MNRVTGTISKIIPHRSLIRLEADAPVGKVVAHFLNLGTGEAFSEGETVDFLFKEFAVHCSPEQSRLSIPNSWEGVVRTISHGEMLTEVTADINSTPVTAIMGSDDWKALDLAPNDPIVLWVAPNDIGIERRPGDGV